MSIPVGRPFLFFHACQLNSHFPKPAFFCFPPPTKYEEVLLFYATPRLRNFSVPI